jgi:hypothetical protein
VRQDPFVGCFNIPQKRKEKVAMKGLTFNANMDKFVKKELFLLDGPCMDVSNLKITYG